MTRVGRTLLVLLLTGALASCLGREPETVIRLTWWITYATDSDEYSAFEAIAAAFTEQTGTVVELVSVPWDDIAPRGTSSRLSLLFDEGDGPDLWGPVPHTWLEPYVSRDQALVLTPEQMRNYSQYDALALHASRLGGDQYALPLLMDSVALIYNRTLVPKPPTTFESLLEIAHEHTDPDSGRWGLVLPLLSPTHLYPFVDGYGGYIFACQVVAEDHTSVGTYVCDPQDVGLNNEGAVRGLQLVSDLYVQEDLFPSALADSSQMVEQATQLFVSGQAAMLIDGPWVLPTLRETEIDFGVAALPPLPGASRAPRPLTVVYGLSANAHTEHPDQVLALMNHVAAPESIAALTGALNKAPARRDVARQSQLEHARDWRDQATAGVLLPPLPELDVVWSPWARALAEAVPGLRPAQEAMDEAVEQIQDTLAEAAGE
jgi:maltose-binding protein MalE